MLILAGVSLNAIIGDNGIITQAQKAKDLYEKANEKEKIEMIMFDKRVSIYDGNNDTENMIGIPLYDKTFENADKWNIIYDKNNNKIYGTGWRYIPVNTEIDGIKTNHSFLINYETGEIIEYKEGDDRVVNLTFKDNVGVSEGLIFNLDSGLIEDVKYDDNGNLLTPVQQKEKLQDALGSNVELIDMNFMDENTGISSTEFRFDGIDDLIKINNINLADFKNGVTYEFYGKLIDGRTCSINTISENDYNQAILEEYEDTDTCKGLTYYTRNIFGTDYYFKSYYRHSGAEWMPFFQFGTISQYSDDVNSKNHWNIKYKDFCYFQSDSRFGLGNGGYFSNFGYGCYSEDFGGSNPIDYWNVVTDGHEPIMNTDVYLQITVDMDSEEIVFIENGQVIYKHQYLKEWWEGNQVTNQEDRQRIENIGGISYLDGIWVGNGFLDSCSSNTILIGGFCNGGYLEGFDLNKSLSKDFGFSRLDCYNIKVYNRGLTYEELEKNREKSIVYRQLLLDKKDS